MDYTSGDDVACSQLPSSQCDSTFRKTTTLSIQANPKTPNYKKMYLLVYNIMFACTYMYFIYFIMNLNFIKLIIILYCFTVCIFIWK